VLLILVGVALLSDNLGLVQLRDVWTYWPLLLVGFGVVKMLEARGNQSGVIFGGIVASIGTLWFLDHLGVVRFNAGLVWPLILIGAGVLALMRTLERQRGLQFEGGPTGEAESRPNGLHLYAIFGGSKRSVNSMEFKGGDATSIFGGIDLDLREARIAGNRAIFDVNMVFGGLEIKVPQTWNVTMEAFSIFGGVEDNTVHSSAPDAPEFVVTGSVVFGGVAIKN
jgi:hypothetical protein